MEDALAQDELFEGVEEKQKVLILVLMEDALAPVRNVTVTPKENVLILVLMEDALAPGSGVLVRILKRCLNPCFNGRCTRTV